MTRALTLKGKLDAGETVLGAWLTFTDICVAEIMADAGYDFVIIDAEHAPWTITDIQRALVAFRGSPTVPMLRVPSHDPAFIKQALDAGIEGIMAPMIQSASEAKALVQACRYPPQGKRGFGPRRASGYWQYTDSYVESSSNIFVIPQIESIEAIDQIDAILEVEGIDALAFGPADLSGSLGVLCQLDHPTVLAALDRLYAAARTHGIPTLNGKSIPQSAYDASVAAGTRMLVVTGDTDLLLAGLATRLSESRQAGQPVT